MIFLIFRKHWMSEQFKNYINMLQKNYLSFNGFLSLLFYISKITVSAAKKIRQKLG